MKFVALLSGGKDSCFSAMEAVNAGHELICLANLYPEAVNGDDEINSFMYQSAAHKGIPMLAECFEKTLFRRQIKGKSIDQTLTYSEGTEGHTDTYDEVEDLYLLLYDVKKHYPDIEAVCCGAIISNYQRHRVEKLCQRLGLVSLTYLWERNRLTMLRDMIDQGVDAVLVKVAGMGLLPYKHLGKSLSQLQPSFLIYHEKYGLDMCGEGGEYESFVLDCPLFPRFRMVIDESQIVVDAEDDSIGSLVLQRCHLVLKSTGCVVSEESRNYIQIIDYSVESELGEQTPKVIAVQPVSQPLSPSVKEALDAVRSCPLTNVQCNIPHYRMNVDGYGTTAVMFGQVESTKLQKPLTDQLGLSDLCSQLHQIFTSLAFMLQMKRGLTQSEPVDWVVLRDIVFVQLYISDMKWFAAVNEVYSQYFTQSSPPSRACVAVPLPSGCLVAVGTVFYLASHPDTVFATSSAGSKHELSQLQRRLALRRQVLHISSVSNWAPVCIGPYSQCNSIANGLVCFVAGQIALDAGRMLVESSSLSLRDEIVRQLNMCIQHCHRVLASVQCMRWNASAGCSNISSLILYVSESAVQQHTSDCVSVSVDSMIPTILDVIRHGVQHYTGMGDQYIDHHASQSHASSDSNSDIDSDENVSNASNSETEFVFWFDVPISIVQVKSLPRGAMVEVEVVAVNKGKIGYSEEMDSTVMTRSIRGEIPVPTLLLSTAPVSSAVDPFSPLYALMSADAVINSNNAAAAHPISKALPSSPMNIVADTIIDNHSLKLVYHEWKHLDCCATGAIECFINPVAATGGGDVSLYQRGCVAVLQVVQIILNQLKVSEQAVVNVKMYYEMIDSAGVVDIEAIGNKALCLVFGSSVSSAVVPLVSYIPVCKLYSSLSANSCNGNLILSCHYTVIDPLQMKTMNWVFQER